MRPYLHLCLLACLVCLAPHPVRAEGAISDATIARARRGIVETSPMRKKLASFIVPVLNADDITVRDLLVQLRAKAKEVDPEGEGFNMMIKAKAAALDEKVTLDFQRIAILDVLDCVEQTTDIAFHYERYAVVVVDKPPATK